MKRPVYYRQATWDFVIARIGNAAIEHVYDSRQPGKAAFSSGILEHPDLLEDTVIELPDQAKYVIDRAAADQIKRRDPDVVLKRLGDAEEQSSSLKEIIQAVKMGSIFDQLSD